MSQFLFFFPHAAETFQTTYYFTSDLQPCLSLPQLRNQQLHNQNSFRYFFTAQLIEIIFFLIADEARMQLNPRSNEDLHRKFLISNCTSEISKQVQGCCDHLCFTSKWKTNFSAEVQRSIKKH